MANIYWYICTQSGATPTLPVEGDQRQFNRAAANAIQAVSRSRQRVGDLTARPVVKPIPDHLLCDGSAVARTDFPQLFVEIGTVWGVGDGTTTFNIPNLLGATLPNATTAPAQTVSTGGTVSTGETVTNPTNPGQTGGTTGGNTSSGGIARRSLL